MTTRSWLRDRPRLLERAYDATLRLARAARPLGIRLGRPRVDALLRPLERTTKGWAFGCRMCGQCVLHATGMTCPMTCPKNLRNGPCGGVRPDGACEVDASTPCIWVQAWERAARMPRHGIGIHELQPPLDRRREGSASWTDELLGGADRTTAAR